MVSYCIWEALYRIICITNEKISNATLIGPLTSLIFMKYSCKHSCAPAAKQTSIDKVMCMYSQDVLSCSINKVNLTM